VVAVGAVEGDWHTELQEYLYENLQHCIAGYVTQERSQVSAQALVGVVTADMLQILNSKLLLLPDDDDVLLRMQGR
jgi:hypothetical protein